MASGKWPEDVRDKLRLKIDIRPHPSSAFSALWSDIRSQAGIVTGPTDSSACLGFKAGRAPLVC